MNYILVQSTVQRGLPRVFFPEPTYIDYYAENDTATVLEAQLMQVLMAQCPHREPHRLRRPPQTAGRRRKEEEEEEEEGEEEEEEEWRQLMASAHGFSYSYTVKLPPLAVLEFLKQHGYKVVGTNTIGDSFIWTLEK